MSDNDSFKFVLRPNHGDRLYDQQLLRNLQIVNAHTAAERGPLPAGGMPVAAKRKPDVSYSKLSSRLGAVYPEATNDSKTASMYATPELNSTEDKMINQETLKDSAELLELALSKHIEDEQAKILLQELTPLLSRAKEKLISNPIDRMNVPGAYHFSDGSYRNLINPNVEQAYVNFVTELTGGISEDEKEIMRYIEEYKNSRRDAGHE